MRPETHAETVVINHVWRMTRHTVADCCGRYVQTNDMRKCRRCTVRALWLFAALGALFPNLAEPVEDDLSFYDY